jgi:hypothetical protein
MSSNRKMGAALAFVAFLAPGSVAWANCEGISNPFAYNECLAKQGPQRSVRVPRTNGGDPEATARDRARYNPSRDNSTSSGVRITRNRNRSSAVIDPWAAIKRAFTPAPRRKRG